MRRRGALGGISGDQGPFALMTAIGQRRGLQLEHAEGAFSDIGVCNAVRNGRFQLLNACCNLAFGGLKRRPPGPWVDASVSSSWAFAVCDHLRETLVFCDIE